MCMLVAVAAVAAAAAVLHTQIALPGKAEPHALHGWAASKPVRCPPCFRTYFHIHRSS